MSVGDARFADAAELGDGLERILHAQCGIVDDGSSLGCRGKGRVAHAGGYRRDAGHAALVIQDHRGHAQEIAGVGDARLAVVAATDEGIGLAVGGRGDHEAGGIGVVDGAAAAGADEAAGGRASDGGGGIAVRDVRTGSAADQAAGGGSADDVHAGRRSVPSFRQVLGALGMAAGIAAVHRAAGRSADQAAGIARFGLDVDRRGARLDAAAGHAAHQAAGAAGAFGNLDVLVAVCSAHTTVMHQDTGNGRGSGYGAGQGAGCGTGGSDHEVHEFEILHGAVADGAEEAGNVVVADHDVADFEVLAVIFFEGTDRIYRKETGSSALGYANDRILTCVSREICPSKISSLLRIFHGQIDIIILDPGNGGGQIQQVAKRTDARRRIAARRIGNRFKQTVGPHRGTLRDICDQGVVKRNCFDIYILTRNKLLGFAGAGREQSVQLIIKLFSCGRYIVQCDGINAIRCIG